MTPRRDADQDRRRQRILDAALAIASTGGFEAVRMRAVADRAEITVATLYQHFPSKVHLLVCALARELERIGRGAHRANTQAGSPYQRLCQVIGRLDRAMQRNPLLAEAMTRALMCADASATVEVDRVTQLMNDMFVRAMSDGQPTDEHYLRARVIADVWMSNLLAWLNRRASISDITTQVDFVVRLVSADL